MPDDLRIPDVGVNVRGRAPLSSDAAPGGYRARRAGSAQGRDWMKLGAAGLGGLLLLGMGGYAVLGRHASTVPVIEADSRPIRVKPDNPGGMQIAGADESTLSDDRTSRDGMAPAAEVPAPQALRAQMQQAAPAAPTAAPPAVAAPTAAATPAAPSSGPAPVDPAAPKPAAAAASTGASPLPDTPASPAAKTAAPLAIARPVAKELSKDSGKPAPGGATMVQLGALSSEDAARAEWQRLARRLAGGLDGKQPTITKVERDGNSFWRLRTGGFADIADATAFCARLKGKGAPCAIASF